MRLREKIADCVKRAILDGGFGEEEAADAILKTIAESVPPLEWERDGDQLRHRSHIGHYDIYPNQQGNWTLDDGEAVSAHDIEDAAIEAANTHHRQTILKAAGWEA